MKRKLLLVVAVGLAIAVFALSRTAKADAPGPAPVQNTAVVEVTINSAGELTVGGISLRALGLAPVDSSTVQIAKNLDSAHLVFQQDVVTVDVNGSPVMKLQWTPSSRQAVAEMAARYGYATSPEVLGRIEEWINSSSVDITARYTNDVSKAMTISLTKPILVDVGAQGQLAVEKGPIAGGVDPSVVQSIQQSGVRNALLCWNKGKFTAKADGKDLPTITLDRKGVQFLTEALGQTYGFALGNLGPAFDAKLGVDVSVAGGNHQAGANCGD